jgi:predicted XRE-type DNA-binding protein
MKSQSFKSVWDAIEDTSQAATSMKIRSEIMIALRDHIEKWKVTQAEAAKRLGITQPRLNDLMGGKIHRFSLSALFDLAARAGLEVQVKVKKAA